MEIGNGFLKLQEENSRRSSVFIQKPPDDLKDGVGYTTRINCGCGDCLPFRVKVEKEEGSLRIGRLVLAPNCHLILLVFGFCFLIIGSILTLLAYKTKHLSQLSRTLQGDDSGSGDEEKVAGPLFLVVGSVLLSVGTGLALLTCKLKAGCSGKAQNRFFLNPNNTNPDYQAELFSTFSNLDEVRSEGGENNRSRRGSFFGSSFNGRRSTLSTIAQAVPVGFFMSDSPRTPKSPNSPKDGTNFQEIELSSPARGPQILIGPSGDESQDSKPALSLRPSLPIPFFSIPNSRTNGGLEVLKNFGSSRSDEPFGSIVSLSSGTGDIACFPVHWHPPLTQVQEETSRHSNMESNRDQSELPPIKVNEYGNALTATQKSGLRQMREVRSEERSGDADEGSSSSKRRGSQL